MFVNTKWVQFSWMTVKGDVVYDCLELSIVNCYRHDGVSDNSVYVKMLIAVTRGLSVTSEYKDAVYSFSNMRIVM